MSKGKFVMEQIEPYQQYIVNPIYSIVIVLEPDQIQVP